jgi:acyl-CoA thioester hydrolase
MEKPSSLSETPGPYSLDTRVYYEDTDAGGVVYYANYLKYLERCRTEWLRSVGHDQSELLREHNMAFMVKRVEADYLRPAILDDLLTVELHVEKLGAAQIVFLQNVVRDAKGGEGEAEVLVSARVQVVCVNMVTMKPMPIPGWMKDQLRTLV